MFNPAISIIIPFFNAEKTIERCVKSLISQTIIKDVEFIFIDDCSSDNSVKLLLEIIQMSNLDSSQYRIIRLLNNAGSAYTRAIGIRAAQGKYVGFCDSDDWVENDMFERMINVLELTKADIVECEYYINSEYKQYKINLTQSKSLIKDMVGNTHPTCLWNKVFKRELFYDNDTIPFGGMGEDFVFCIQALLRSKKYQLLKTPLYHYWQNPNSISNSIKIESLCKRALDLRNNSMLVFRILEDNGLNKDLGNAIIVRKILSKIMLSSGMSKSNIRKMFFQEIFPEINLKIFLKKIPFTYKKAYFFAITTIKSRVFNYEG